MVFAGHRCKDEHFSHYTDAFILISKRVDRFSWQASYTIGNVFGIQGGASISLNDDGYLVDPEGPYSNIFSKNAAPFTDIVSTPCLILLAEPGMGKTQTMQMEKTAIDEIVSQQGGQTLWLNLRSYSSEDRLIRDLFEDPRFLAWRTGSHRLHLFLDSLDEALLRIDTLAAILVDELQKHPVERLALRIACRTAEWPISLETGLRDRWGKEHVGVYELAPLRRVDVAEAARANEVDPEIFLHLVSENQAVPFAIKPVTLNFLLNTYRQNHTFPRTQTELFLKGCRLLAAESNETRRDARRTGVFSAEQRLHMAGQIAAVTIFANRYAIWTDIDRGDVPEEDVPVSDLLLVEEAIEGTAVSEATIRETLGTALFSSRGQHRMGWAHQTYAEVLAASYLIQQQMTLDQIMSLLIHPDGKVVPQLHEVTAWLASMDHNIFRCIMQVDPSVLLRSDVATVDIQDRKALVANLLQLLDAEQLLAHNSSLYRKLRHPDLAAQVRPYIRDHRKGELVRRAAIDMAEECTVHEVLDDLVAVALNQNDELSVRTAAAHAIVGMGDELAKLKLKPLALEQAGEDPDDQLKGYGLMAVWSDHLTADELFAVLHKPKNTSFFGSYEYFLGYNFIQCLQPTALPAALRWVANQPSRDVLEYTFRNPINSILRQGWMHLDLPNVLPLFAEAAWSRLKHHEAIVDETDADRDPAELPFVEMLRDDYEKRRRVVIAILDLLSAADREWVWLLCSGTPLVMKQDVPWMIQQLSLTQFLEEQTKWALLIGQAFDQQDNEQREIIYAACQQYPILAEQFAGLFNPIALDSDLARQLKANHYEHVTWQQRHKRPLLDPPPAEHVARALDHFEAGNMDAWWQLHLELTLKPDSTHYTNSLEADLTKFVGWLASNTATKTRIIEAAKQYILKADPQTYEWLGTNKISYSAIGGYRALRLIVQEDNQFLNTLPKDIWQRWAAIILSYPSSSLEKERSIREGLVTLAYQFAPDEILHTLSVLIDAENKQGDYLFSLSKVKDCWDARLAHVLVNKLSDTNLKPNCVTSIVEELLKHQVHEAHQYAQSLIPSQLPTQGEGLQKAISAACLLVQYSDDAGWSILWPAILGDTNFGREVISVLASRGDRRAGNVGNKLTEEQLAALFLWLEQQYPHVEVPKYDQAMMHEITLREHIRHWRDGVLHHLQQRGTPQACEALLHIAHELPHLDFLKRAILEAQAITRRRTWAAPHPATIIRLVHNKQARLVQNGEHLLSVLMDSLVQLEKKLQGITPAAQFLWDEMGKGTYRPKDENSFSDYVKIHLDEDIRQRGIIVNREVEIRRGIGGKGERTDIHVNAVMKEAKGQRYDVVTIIIEVKGSWHPEVPDAMETQLVNRYLKDNECNHGLYLVGWFNCPQWKAEARRNQAFKLGHDKQAIQNQLDDQAKQLSQQGVFVKACVLDARLRYEGQQ